MKQPTRFRISVGGPEHIGVLGEKLAELALLRVDGLIVLKPPPGSTRLPFDFVAMASTGSSFLVEVQAYSSYQLKIEPESIAVLELVIDADRLQIARESQTPVVMFLFDGDRGHGRYLRLDALPKPGSDAETAILSFPIENTITRDSIHALATELIRGRLVPASA